MSQVIMASSEREFAIVVFGASGFTGQFVVREVAKNCKGKFKWAIAGRSKDKLEKVLQETASELGRYTALVTSLTRVTVALSILKSVTHFV